MGHIAINVSGNKTSDVSSETNTHNTDQVGVIAEVSDEDIDNLGNHFSSLRSIGQTDGVEERSSAPVHGNHVNIFIVQVSCNETRLKLKITKLWQKRSIYKYKGWKQAPLLNFNKKNLPSILKALCLRVFLSINLKFIVPLLYNIYTKYIVLETSHKGLSVADSRKLNLQSVQPV